MARGSLSRSLARHSHIRLNVGLMADMRRDIPIHGRRRFLIGAAGVAAAPLVVGLAGCGTDRQPSQPSVTEKDNAEPNSVAAATTVTGVGALEASTIGLGCQTMPGKLYGPVSSRADMVRLTRTAVDQGITFFDTAEAYGPLESERIVGEALQPARDQVVIATKFGFDFDPRTGERRGGPNSRPDHIRRVVDEMLGRLRTDRIDLLYQHRVDPTVPIEDVADGEGPHLPGQSASLRPLRARSPDCTPCPRRATTDRHSERVLDALARTEAEILPICDELGIGFVPWAPLGMGFTTGTINPATRFTQGDFRANVPRFRPEAMAANMPLVQLISDWAVRKGATPAQMSLAWLLAQHPSIVPIPSTTRTAHLLENAGAEEVMLTNDELVDLNAAVGRITIFGDRLPPAVMAQTGVEAPPL